MNDNDAVRILFVDDEERILRSLALQFRRQYQVATETNPAKVMERLAGDTFDIIVSDQRMPQMTGSQLLSQIQHAHPDSLRILLTGYSDLDAAVDALNSGGIFRYLTKPWDQQDLANTLAQAAEIVRHRRRYLKRNPVAAPEPASLVEEKRIRLLLIDDDSETLQLSRDICARLGVGLQAVSSLDGAMARLNEDEIDILLSDIRLGDDDLRPLLMSLAQAHPQLLTVVVTPFQDTQLLLKLINQAQIFRYLPKPVRRGMLERAIKTAVTQVAESRRQPHAPSLRQAEAPRAEEEQSRVNNFMGMLGRLRQRLTA
ncbi:response regulator [uncultured Pseudomonas sp.]|uniref:response regulator n=1 Tax=uncultured Pseudomonas sp. TaxID=114707 RepID=UPI0030DBD8F2|tara:strand:+ start:9556 stop:10497 length:942 start_codon:yes stop_codon:yes gene_type:complete